LSVEALGELLGIKIRKFWHNMLRCLQRGVSGYFDYLFYEMNFLRGSRILSVITLYASKVMLKIRLLCANLIRVFD